MTATQISVGVQALIQRDGHLLTVVKQYPDEVAYILPGGGQRPGEPLDAALIRECHEELGVSVSVGPLCFVREYIGANHEHAAEDSHLHLLNIVFACTIAEGDEPRLGPQPDDEQIGVAWLPLAELDRYRFYPAALRPALMRQALEPAYVGDIN